MPQTNSYQKSHEICLNACLPKEGQSWPLTKKQQKAGKEYVDADEVSLAEVRSYAEGKFWSWPQRRIYFLCDLHADTEAFLLSLVASGGVVRTGRGDGDLQLTDEGKEALFLIGGDCFDKGPNNLRLLRCIKKLIDTGADVSILAGNHDLRTFLGLSYAGRRELKFQHLFVRMGKKTMPLFKEIIDENQEKGIVPQDLLDTKEIHDKLFPSEEWYLDFAKVAGDLISTQKVEKEVRRIREKAQDLDMASAALGMSLGEVHWALTKAQELFLQPDGEFHWYFERMQLALQHGSFLFVHAGVDDVVAETLAERGVSGLNEWYKELIRENLFDLYHGSVGNAFRTKYRILDYPMSAQGVQSLHDAGIYAIVHGHRNLMRGQRITLRANVLNFECDASVDKNTRQLEGLEGPGGAVMVFEPQGSLKGISTDYPFIRTFEPERVFDFTSLSPPTSPQPGDSTQ